MAAATTTLVRTGMKYAAVGAGVGLGVGILNGVLKIKGQRSSSSPSSPDPVIGDYPYLAADPDALSASEALLPFRNLSPKYFNEVKKNLNSLLKLQVTVSHAQTAKVVWPSVSQRFLTKAIDALRNLRKVVETHKPALLVDMDESLQVLQKVISDTNYNISMDTAALLDS